MFPPQRRVNLVLAITGKGSWRVTEVLRPDTRIVDDVSADIRMAVSAPVPSVGISQKLVTSADLRIRNEGHARIGDVSL